MLFGIERHMCVESLVNARLLDQISSRIVALPPPIGIVELIHPNAGIRVHGAKPYVQIPCIGVDRAGTHHSGLRKRHGPTLFGLSPGTYPRAFGPAGKS